MRFEGLSSTASTLGFPTAARGFGTASSWEACAKGACLRPAARSQQKLDSLGRASILAARKTGDVAAVRHSRMRARAMSRLCACSNGMLIARFLLVGREPALQRKELS